MASLSSVPSWREPRPGDITILVVDDGLMLRLVIPKGSLENQTLALFEAADIRLLRGSDRDYHGTVDDPRLDRFSLLRPQEMPLRVLYMTNGANGIPDLWAVVPGQPDSATQLTFTEGGVFDYAPSPDGRRIAFAERDIDSNRITLKLLDLSTGRASLLSDCAATNADCHTPVWRPDGSAIAYVTWTRQGGHINTVAATGGGDLDHSASRASVERTLDTWLDARPAGRYADLLHLTE